ncbi:hypothetical protein [Dethiosulfatarculus sandiegensis]|uniref:Yip1 domain-containing protein n=1 Tax=Dethiosulfatarculus sandiegensis TaxID=1429043 RepID=A0A0D2JYS7_9BACT|nr:hypothetical protein [Dethiosulfatarculus sandiegensis]KIX14715.1 hypothetical protein X474_07450 [Dethiosulfatarculus sandiegensis]
MNGSKLLYRADSKKDIVVPKNLFQWIRMAFVSPPEYLTIFQDIGVTKVLAYFLFFTFTSLLFFSFGLLLSNLTDGFSFLNELFTNYCILKNYFYEVYQFFLALLISYGIVFIPYFILVTLFAKLFNTKDITLKKSIYLIISLQIYNFWLGLYPIFYTTDWSLLCSVFLLIGATASLWSLHLEKNFMITLIASWLISIRILKAILGGYLDVIIN